MTETLDRQSSAAPLRSSYDLDGYVVVRDLVPHEPIDALVRAYEGDIVPSRDRFLRQSTFRYERNDLTDEGFVRQSFLNIHDYRRHGAFSQRALDIFLSASLRSALQSVTGFPSFYLMQTMLFDANTATPAHQDAWYLDSVPNGHLLAVWIALEDIHEYAGRFWLLPGSHREEELIEGARSMRHTEWKARIARFVEANRDRVHAPALKKGDCIFWNSKTVHGALPTRDRRRSRRSLTAHYLPAHLEFGNLHETVPWGRFGERDGMRFMRSHEYGIWEAARVQLVRWLHDSPSTLRLARGLKRVVASSADRVVRRVRRARS